MAMHAGDGVTPFAMRSRPDPSHQRHSGALYLNMPDRIHLDGLFRQIVEAIPNAMVMIDQSGRVEMLNTRAEQVFGYERNEIRGSSIEMLLPERLRDRLPCLGGAFFTRWQAQPLMLGQELYAVRKDGGEFPVEIGLNPIETDEGPMALVAIVDNSHRREEEGRIRAALREKEILLAEIHHRVKNNLQIIHSLLHLQSTHITDPATLALLRDSESRVRSMALIHQTLYESNDFAKVDFAVFLDTLLPDLVKSYGIDTNRIAIRTNVEPVRLPIDIAVPCGLAVAELITNAFRHAFPKRKRGEIHVALHRRPGNEALLSVSDSGVGLPEHLDIANSDTLGLQLLGQLAGQMEGELSINRSDPTRFSLRFPI